ncbi:SDR family NAD(P)-dependent oxidoreductase [Frankia sp. CNm7]|uniref:SDR family NAD(P)-dependent oxidoreductase n=1 Tax=Frankia nepalensis TaxID=1836974 RepID=A0A937UN02_9ACTN|nr:SDR family NAD(P)-dependent oxidoreductase [Frankia nepalensis]MBL7496668.1 SDR family NAD(P)-dependent oxidoreductase [Frankia nepalensis]MBL7510690.1 SDR family NAD(P)-dependent oxidoreductase [Frankia nepalensis]MBL7516677.1 SDR family NAD(P)-dependent oxidoreductase [Frankia nepalensis]MBL7627407.1 SDR family NAD(P)-dependent oxidoreductase [Frankia nepalensis]
MDNGVTQPVAIVTGANTGIGLETALGLAEQGMRVVATARDPRRGAEAVAEIERRTGRTVDLVPLDLASFASIRRFAATVLERYPRIDVLVHNAGLAPGGHRWETAEGFEAAFGVNHLGPFLLTGLLRDRIVASAPARIMIVSSGAYRMAPDGLCFDDLQHRENFHTLQVYAESKTANIYFTHILARQLAGTGVTVNAVNPGYVATQLGQPREADLAHAVAVPRDNAASSAVLANLPEPMTAARGAIPSITLATAAELATTTGVYFDRTRPATLTPVAADLDLAQRLWDESERLVALHPAH